MGLGSWLKNIFKREEPYQEIVIAVDPIKPDKKYEAKKVLYQALTSIGLSPSHMYNIGHVQVDFGFPKEKIAVEVLMPYESDTQRDFDKRKFHAIKNFGWKTYGFSADEILANTQEISDKIKKIIAYNKRP